MRDIIEVLLGTALRIGECLALRVCDVDDGPHGMAISVTGTVVLRTGSGAVRQDHPKTEHSSRRIAVPDFAAAVIAHGSPASRPATRNGRSSPVARVSLSGRSTCDEPSARSLSLADLAGEGITLCWYRRTGATVIARGASADAAATFLGQPCGG